MSRKSDHNERRLYDSTGQYGGRMFSVAVVGLSGTEKDKGCLGVGKSCLCNRFVRPQADEYNRDHISVLSQTDFSGPIVNNEHWLYWGETRKCTEEGFELTFSIIEQTEFVDDACFQPFRSGKMEPYYKRCAATRLSSAEKLMYVCKNQLGIEKEYEQHYLPDGRFNVDGFICVFDVSEIQGREISRQVDLTALILSTLLKTKKPVVLVTTKNDELYEPYVREAEKLIARREFKNLIPLVETSAHDNVNVDLAFWACVQRDWTKGKTKIVSYMDSYQRQRDQLDAVNDAYLNLIRSQITDYRTPWNNTYVNLSQSRDFLRYCDLFGQQSAQQTFKRHVKKLRDDYICRKMQMYLRTLPKVLNQLLPDLDSFGPEQSWPEVQKLIRTHPLFESHFLYNESLPWQDIDDSSDTRIPFDLLATPEAEKVFVDHRESLLREEHLRNLRHQFSELLRETSILPGQPLKEIRMLLAGRECVETLTESELVIIYEDYQRLLQKRAHEQLLELFQEQASLFQQYCNGDMVTQEDLSSIAAKLSDDERWTALDQLPQDRDLALIRHLGFIQWPIKEHCPAFHACADISFESFCSSLAKRRRHPLWNAEPEEVRVKLTVLGVSGLADNLANVVKAMRSSLDLSDSRVFLDVQASTGADGSVGILVSRLYPNWLEPEGYLCVYSSRSSLEFVRKSLEQSLLTDLQFGNSHHTGPASIGLPLVLLLATSPETSAKERSYLREEGQNRAQSLQCAFFDVTSDEPHARFKPDELLRALMYLTESVVRRTDLMHVYNSGTSLDSIIPEGTLNPEIRILLCLMCGDPIMPSHFLELLLLPNSLPNTTFYPISKHSFVTDVGCLVALDGENDDANVDLSQVPNRYVEFVLTSYHGSYAYKDELLHGYILVYWSKRQASFSNLSALASSISPAVPIQMLALVENESRPSKLSHQLAADGQRLAQSLKASFSVSTLSPHLGRCISSFLNYSLQNKLQIEKGFQIGSAAASASQLSPGSVISATVQNECYDFGAQQHFGSLMPAAPHQLAPSSRHRSRQDAADQGDSIYERLPEEQSATARCDPHKVGSESGYGHGLPASLVMQTRNADKHVHSYGTSAGLLEPEDETEDSAFFTPLYDENNVSGEEHLVKPSQLKQHRRRLNYYNLQSYPSADSLDRVYSIDSAYGGGHYYGNVSSHMGQHYGIHHRLQSGESAIIDPAYNFDHPPPRPNSSAHVMIPPHSSQPPPYSRVAASPPPAYKLHSPYVYGNSNEQPEAFYSPHYLSQTEQFENSSSYYPRRLHYHPFTHQHQPLSHQFRSYSPPFEPYPGLSASNETSGEHYLSVGLGRPELGSLVGSYRNSPLIYATTSRGHHARSSHFHQLGNPLSRHQLYGQGSTPQESVSPYAVGRYFTSQAKPGKKKKKHHSKSRSSSSKGHRSSMVHDDDDEEDEEEEEQNVQTTNRNTNKNFTKLRKRRTETGDKSKKRTEKSVIEDNRFQRGESSKIVQDEDKEATGGGGGGGGGRGGLPYSDSDSELVLEQDEELDAAADEDEEETVSSNNSADDHRLINADSYALSSGWAYHQNSEPQTGCNAAAAAAISGTTARHNFAEQWPPPQSDTVTEDSLTNDRFRTNPGKLDLKRFNNLSDAIGRLNLNSPLGPTRSNPQSTFDGTEYSRRNNYSGYSPEQLNMLGQSNRRGRLKDKQLSGSKDADSESEASDSVLVDQLPSASTLSASSNSTHANAFHVAKSLATTGQQKKLQKKRRVVPVPVAPPRLPTSANNSTAVTPTTSGAGKLFMAATNSSFDDSQQDRLPSEASSTLDDTVGQDGKTTDLEQSQLGETRRTRWQQMPKLYSLQADTDVVSNGAGGGVGNVCALDDNSNLFSVAAKETNGDVIDKKVLKSKSVGTFAELDNKKSKKLEKKRQKEERKSRKAQKEAATGRNRSRSKSVPHSALEEFAQSNGNAVPLFIEKCTLFIEKEGLDMEGIYRVPGNRAHVDTLLQQFDENPEIDIAELDIPVNAVATALKDFFMKRLPPIFPSDCMADIANLSKQYSDVGQLDEIRTFLLRLPKANYQIIHFMIGHFAKVVEKSAINSMDSKNLAICWWPTLLQFEFSDMFVFEQKRPHLMNFVQILIDSCHELFNTTTTTATAHNSGTSVMLNHHTTEVSGSAAAAANQSYSAIISVEERASL